GLTVFGNATYFIKSETRKYDEIALYQGPLGGPAAQQAINNSVGQFVLPYSGRSIIPGGYDWLANLGAIYRPDKKTIVNAILRYRGTTQDPIMKFGVNPQVATIPSSLIVDASIGRDIFEQELFSIRAIFSVNNLFNVNYQTFVHYPMRGRFISVGLTTSFR
ncbi:MAG: hypothetical protein RMI34_06025, partial [Chloroherpetonaceae bacterium]|nr:TonB-dependent receptor [Chloroherpetonaceae bacterium]MDW8019616.1 hypothetical protein [Chloroherpetonaceae bacterium]